MRVLHAAQRGKDVVTGPETALDLLEQSLVLMRKKAEDPEDKRLGRTTRKKMNAGIRKQPLLPDPASTTSIWRQQQQQASGSSSDVIVDQMGVLVSHGCGACLLPASLTLASHLLLAT